MLRLFVGLALPPDVAARLAGLATNLPGARWVEPENLHITLRFIGEVSDADAEDLHHELARLEAKPLTYDIAGMDTFGQGRKAHALFAGVTLTPELELLQTRVEAAVVRAGQPRESRKFKPHVTIARLKAPPEDRLLGFIQAHNLFRAGPIPTDHFVLYESRMGNGGSAYFPLAEYPLA
jgi:RNA 2',3'-cyclic 3'-phosphodiesterase